MEHIVTHRDKDPIFTIKDVTDREVGLESVAVCREVWGVYDISQEEGVTPFLCPQLRPIYCGRLHYHPGPGLCCPLQSTCTLDREPFQCRCHCLFRPLLVPSPNCRPNLPEAGRVVFRPELHLAPECFNEVSCDDTGRRPVLRGCKCWVRKVQSRLFHWQTGDLSLWCYLL